MTCDTSDIFLSLLKSLSTRGFSVGVGFNENKPTWAEATYSQDWVDHYVKNSFLLEDPTVLHGQKFSGHFTWSDLETLYPDNKVFAASRRFGLIEGNTISLKISGVSTIASCSGPPWDETQQRKAQAAISALHFLNIQRTRDLILTQKELAVVSMMADGLKDRDIAERLGLKIESVRKRRQQAYEKTGCLNPASLVSFVIKNSWL